MDNKVDFLELSKRAMAQNSTIDDKNNLYKAFFDLKEWAFIVPKGKDLANAQPFVTKVDGQSWIFVFTDGDKAQQFGKANPELFVNDDGGIFFISIKIKDALKMIYDAHKNGVFGMQINYGLPGWFGPINTIPGIITHLSKVFPAGSGRGINDITYLNTLENKPQ